MSRRSLTGYKFLIVFLVASLAITGISYLDDSLWNLIMLIVGMTAYAIVGVLYSIRAISGSRTGKEAYAVVFILLLFLGYCIYQGIIKLQVWIVSWPLAVKIIVPSLLLLFLIILLISIKRESRIE